MSNDGQEFEAWVREHELLLQEIHGTRPDQIKTKWRYRTKGRDSGQMREVDVALFVEAGHRTLFIAIECRDRKGRASLTWIEQLATQQRDIGANTMVAVTRNGFSKYARQSAIANKIEVYTLAERDTFGDGKALADIEVTQWLPKARILNLTWRHRAAVLDAFGPIPELSTEELAELSRGFEEAHWLDTETQKAVSMKKILSSSITRSQLLEASPRDGSHGFQSFTIELPDKRYLLDRDLPAGTLIILGFISADFEVWLEPHIIPAKRISQYRGVDDEPILEWHEYDGSFWGLDGQTVYFAPFGKKPSVD